MKSILPIFLGLLLFTFGAYSQTCHVSVVTTARNGGSYQVQGGVEQIYDVVVTNDGTCGVNDIGLTITLPNGASISSSWNIQNDGAYYQVTSYGSVLPVGNSVNVGFIAFFPNQQNVPSGVSVSVYGEVCNGCSSPATTASSSTTSSPSSTTSTASTTSSSTTGTPNGNCHVTAVTTARNGGSYQVQGGVEQIYDVVVTNDGSCGVNDIELTITLPNGASISSSWNINVHGATYQVTSYGSVLPVGSAVNVGFIAFFSNQQNVPSGVSVSVASTTCNQCSSGSSSTTASSSTTSSSTATTASSTTSSSSTTGTPNGNCHVTAVTTARNGASYPSGNGVDQVYDVVITNDGSCNVDNIIVSINLPAGATIASSWNINANGGSLYTVTNYGAPLRVGNTANPGFIVNFPNTNSVPSGVSVTVPTTTCNTCSSGSSSSSTTGSVSTTASSSTTGTPSTTTTTGGSTCNVAVSTVARQNGFYQDSNAFSQIYDITVQNNGNCPASSIVLSLATQGGQITSSWNIQASGNNYILTNYGGQLLHGQSATAGMILSFPTASIPSNVSAALVSASCSC